MPDPEQTDLDLSGEVGAATDVARTGRSGRVPAHEQTVDEDVDVADWDRIAESPEFRALLRAKAAFLVPATIFFFVYYFSLPVLVGWFPELMRIRVGPVNVAYAFALSQFFVAWAVAAVYLRQAARFDEQADALIANTFPRPVAPEIRSQQAAPE